MITKASLALLKMLLTRQRTILIVLGVMTAAKIEIIKAKSSAKVSVLQTVEVTKKILMG